MYRVAGSEVDRPVTDNNLTPKERALIRNEFMTRLSSTRLLHDGILVKRGATGPNTGASRSREPPCRK